MIPTALHVAKAHHSPPARRTVDAFTRLLHALLAICFAGVYITSEGEVFRQVHIILGETLAGLLLARLVWGLWGPRHVRWSALWGKLRGLGSWIEGLRTAQPSWSLAQNLFLALSVVSVLLTLALAVLSGYVTDQAWTGEWMAEVHELVGEWVLMAVLGHVMAVLAVSWLRRRNLAMTMLTGRVQGKGPDLIKSNHVFLAVLLLGAVLSFWVWQWRGQAQAPADMALTWQQSSAGRSQSESEDD